MRAYDVTPPFRIREEGEKGTNPRTAPSRELTSQAPPIGKQPQVGKEETTVADLENRWHLKPA